VFSKDFQFKQTALAQINFKVPLQKVSINPVADFTQTRGSQLNPKTVEANNACSNFGGLIKIDLWLVEWSMQHGVTSRAVSCNKTALAMCIIFKVVHATEKHSA
jgi:hypothetical protein